MQLDEIRVNNAFSTLSVAEYKHGEHKESTPIINKRMIRTVELLEKLKDGALDNEVEYKVDHLFPPNCRYYEKHSAGHIVLIEEPPAFRTIAVDKDMANEIESLRSIGKLEEYGYENWLTENPKRPYMFNLAMPYTIFVLAFNKGFEPMGGVMGFRTQPISGFSDPLCKAPLLNISDSQNVCFGDKLYKGPKRSIFADTQHAVGVFWSTIFNSDYIYNYVAYQDVAGVCDYLTWEYYSHTDPMFIYNVDWIPCERNVGQIVERAKEWILNDRRNNQKQFDYNMITDLFSRGHEKGIEKVPGIDAKEPLIYDVSQYMFVDDDPVYIGDSFVSSNGKIHFIDSFLGFRKVVEPVYINIQREDGRIFRMKLTQRVRRYIQDKVREQKYEAEAILPNGVVLKHNDILVMKNDYGNDVYRKIYYLRLSPEGILEGRFGSEFYIVENLPDDVSVMDLSNPEYKGIKLSVDKEYFILRGSRYPLGSSIPVSFVKFKDVTAGNRNNLVINFQESQGSNQGYNYKLDFSGGVRQHETRLFEIENARKLPEVFRMGRKLLFLRQGDRYSNHSADSFVIPNVGVTVPYNSSLRQAEPGRYMGKFIKDDTFKVESWDLDLEFNIGDKVVAADWKNPINMLTVKQIVGFVENKDHGNIDFALTDKNDNASSHRYISPHRSSIAIGSIRKITNKWEDLSAGMKIVSNKAGVSMFPKKDANIIIGFLYDTGGPEPLVLCSNACTLWYSDVMENFDIIPMTNKKWKTLTHAPINPSKMRFQAGDLINGGRSFRSEMGYLAYRPRDSRTIKAQNLLYWSDYEEAYSFDRRFSREVMFDSFPNPRLTGRQEEDLGFVHAFPNFHGMYTVTGGHHSGFMFANDPRSILNVPDNSE